MQEHIVNREVIYLLILRISLEGKNYLMTLLKGDLFIPSLLKFTVDAVAYMTMDLSDAPLTIIFNNFGEIILF